MQYKLFFLLKKANQGMSQRVTLYQTMYYQQHFWAAISEPNISDWGEGQSFTYKGHQDIKADMISSKMLKDNTLNT